MTLAESSASFVVRSEHQYRHDDRFRFTLRKHFHEDESSTEAHPLSERKGVLSPAVTRAILQDGEVMLANTSQSRQYLRKIAPKHFPFMKDLLRSLETTLSQKHEAGLVLLTPLQLRHFVGQVVHTAQEILLSFSSEEKDDAIEFLQGVAGRHIFAPAGCQPFDTTTRLGKYLGFVDIRLDSPLSRAPVATALLAVPRRYRHEHGWTIITGDYGRLFGGPDFDSSFYVMHDSSASGTYCAQAAIIIVLGLLSDRGAKLFGPIDITYLAVNADPLPVNPPPSKNCSRIQSGAKASFPAYGLRISQIANFFRPGASALSHPIDDSSDPDKVAISYGRARPSPANVSADTVALPKGPNAERLFARLTLAYLQARCPVLLLVDANVLYSPETTDPKSNPHAVVIVGCKSRIAIATQNHLLPSVSAIKEYMIHDPGKQPFMVLPESRLLEAAKRYAIHPIGTVKTPVKTGSELDFEHHIHASFVSDAKILTHASDCVWHILHERNESRKYIWPRTEIGKFAADFSISLLHADEISLTFRQLLDNSSGSVLLQDAAKITASIASGWHWLFAFFDVSANGSVSRLSSIRIYSAERNQDQSFKTSVYLKF